jgi:hypothetical protein
MLNTRSLVRLGVEQDATGMRNKKVNAIKPSAVITAGTGTKASSLNTTNQVNGEADQLKMVEAVLSGKTEWCTIGQHYAEELYQEKKYGSEFSLCVTCAGLYLSNELPHESWQDFVEHQPSRVRLKEGGGS